MRALRFPFAFHENKSEFSWVFIKFGLVKMQILSFTADLLKENPGAERGVI